MKKIAVHDLQEGLIFSRPIYIEGTSLLVPAGIEIKRKDIEQLQAWGIEAVKAEDDMVILYSGAGKASPLQKTSPEIPAAPQAVNADETAIHEDHRKALSLADVKDPSVSYRTYTGLIAWLDKVFLNIAAKAVPDIRFIDSITGRLLNTIRGTPDLFLNYILGGEIQGHYLAKNSVNTAILAALSAQEMRLPNHKIMQIITGALLHDVGMLRLSPEILNKEGALIGEELQLMKSHTLHSYKIVHQELSYPEELGFMALQHHERWDGSGYPQGLSGTEVSTGARIISVADAFEAMVSEKPYRNSLIGYQAMKNLLSDNGRRFDPDVLAAFIKIMGIYPIGSIILLNNGSIARITEIQGIAPLRPKLTIVIDPSGRIYKQNEGKSIDLLMEKNLFIVRALNPKEILRDGF